MTETMIRPDVPTADEAASLSDEELIARYIVHDVGMGPDASWTAWGVPVWILIGHLRGADVAETAEAYDLPEIAVLAALAYYRKRKELIDARILLNEADFE